MWVLAVCHVCHIRMGGSKVLKHYVYLTFSLKYAIIATGLAHCAFSWGSFASPSENAAALQTQPAGFTPAKHIDKEHENGNRLG
jgi:hypothetical protein